MNAKNDSNDWKECFARSSEPYWDALLRFGLSLSKTEDRAQDLLQNTLLRGVRYFERFARQNLDVNFAHEVAAALQDPQKAKHYKNWLYKILRNVYLDELASLKRFPMGASQIDLEELEDFTNVTDYAGTVEDVSESGWSLDKEQRFFKAAATDEMLSELGHLSDRQRSVIYLVAEDHSYKEVAALLDIPLGTVMSTLSRGLQKLKLGLKSRVGIKPPEQQVSGVMPALKDAKTVRSHD